MSELYITGAHFDKESLEQNPLQQGEYEDCSFEGGNLAYADLGRNSFNSCLFHDCDLSMATVENTAFRSVHFLNCKLLGLRFDTCNPFNLSFTFDGCLLQHASFYKLNIRKTVFRNCRLQETDFTECDLGQSVLEHCDLSGALFDQTILEKADLSSALHFSIDPERNKITKARFSTLNLPGLLDKYKLNIV